MDLTALLLVVTAAFAHAGWNFLSKKAAGGALFVWCYSVATAVLYLPPAAWMLWNTAQPISRAGWITILASGVLHVGYDVFLQRGYRVADLSVVYPVARGTGPLLSVVGALALLGETATASAMAGMLLTVLGILAIARIDRLLGQRPPGLLQGVRYGAATGVFIAAYTLTDAYAVRELLIAPLVVDYLASVVRLIVLTPGAWLRRSEVAALPVRIWAYATAVGVLSPLAYILVLMAMQRAPVSIVAPAREMSMMVAALLGTFLLREGDGVRRLLGAGLIIAGTVLLVWR